jgi:O-antigen ligase
MVANHPNANPLEPLHDIGRDRAWPAGLGLEERATDALWITFFVGASSLTLPIDIGPLQPFSRLVWFPADFIAVLFFMRNSALLLALARRNAPLLAWPLLACVSAVWSIAPSLTMYHGVQLLMTMMVGFMLCSYASLTRVLQFFFVATTIGALLSLASIFVFPYTSFDPGGQWKGLYSHKNTLGSTMAIQIATGIFLFLHGWRRIFTAASVLLAMLLLVKSESSSAVVVLAVSLLPLPLIIGYRDNRNRVFFVLGIGLLIIACAAVVLVMEEMMIDPVDLALDALGKERTLTGRTLLWDFARDAIDQNPWLGLGYKGYWEGPGTTATLLRVVTDWPFTFFHNNFLEVTVAFGVFGPVTLIGAILYVLFVSIRTFAANPTFVNGWPLAYLAALTTLCFSENPLFNNHGLPEVILVSIVTANGIPGWIRQRPFLSPPPVEAFPR